MTHTKGTGFLLPPKRVDPIGRLGTAMLSLGAGDVPFEFAIDTTMVFDQESTNSCTACVCAEAARLFRSSRNIPAPVLSPLGLYWPARFIEVGENVTDSGVSPYAIVEAARTFGLPLEADWKLDPTNVNVRPPTVVLQSAQRSKLSVTPIYATGEKLYNLVRATIAQRVPVLIAIGVDDAFRATRDLTPIGPPANAESMLHAVCGWSYGRDGVGIVNSWGRKVWGADGLGVLSPEAVGAAQFVAAIRVTP